MRKPFKLRSGNMTPFKKMGEEEETPEQYNARVRAEHEAKMQAYDDSTASYLNQLEIDKLLGEAFDITKSDPDIFTNPRMDEVYRKRKLAADLQYENMDRGVYTDISDYEKADIGDPFYDELEYTGSKNPDDLRPIKPREPMEMIDPIKIKNIDMLPTTKTPDVIELSKRKYITSADGKWKYNLETGEKTRVKTQKVKKFRKPGKRSVRNLVTGGTNRVQ